MTRVIASWLFFSFLCVLPSYALSEVELRAVIASWGASQPLTLTYPFLTSAPESSSLRVRHLKLSGSRVWIDFGCGTPAECRPFYAIATYDTRHAARDAVSALMRFAKIGAAKGTKVIRAGARVEMKWSGNGIEFQLEGRALQSGGVGDHICIVDKQRRIFCAIVRSSSMVEVYR